MTESSDHVLDLPERARFVLDHCGAPMRFRGSVAQTRGGKLDQSVTTSVRATCDGCGWTVELHLTEPGSTT